MAHERRGLRESVYETGQHLRLLAGVPYQNACGRRHGMLPLLRALAPSRLHRRASRRWRISIPGGLPEYSNDIDDEIRGAY